MTKFIFKSNASDLQKISQSIETIQKNVLYLTYRTDSILKIVHEMVTDKGLQKQVDEYFEDPVDAIDKLQYQKDDWLRERTLRPKSQDQ